MAKNEKKPTVKAPEVKAPETKKEETKEPVNVVQVGDLAKGLRPNQSGGLDANHIVDALTGAKEMLHDNPHAAEDYNMPPEAIKKFNGIVAVGFLNAIAIEITTGTSDWAKRMSATQLECLKEVAPALGIEIDTKLLPAPAADGTVVVTDKAIKVSKETKKALAEEAKKKIPSNPTEVETEEQLKDALTAFLSDPKVTRPFERFMRAINFYRSYLTIQANKSDKKEDELAKIKATSDAELLQDISTMATCPIIVQGFGKYLRGTVEDTKSIIHAFCAFRDASKNRATGLPAVDDETIASIVRVLLMWSCNETIKEESEKLEKIKKGIETLKKDEKANAKAIESESKKISGQEARIAHYRSIIDIILSPSFSVADDFIADYNTKGSDSFGIARKNFGIIMNSYYPDATIDENTVPMALVNVQQRIGIIVNMFVDSNMRRPEYSLENLKEKEEAQEEGSKKE